MRTASWTCPFCPLSCDHLGVRVGAGAAPLLLEGGSCGLAQSSLSTFASVPETSSEPALLDGTPCSIKTAVATAARWLSTSHQPLFAGLHTDVAGARALYPLACASGAICDGDAASVPGLRALPDRGQFTTTLAEVRTRTELIVFVGGLPLAEAPLIAERCGIGQPLLPQRHVVVLGPQPGDEPALAAWAGAGVSVQALALHGDLFNTLGLLALPQPPQELADLAQRMQAARYTVLIGTTARLPREAALIVEAVHHLVGQLNRCTRAAALWIGSSTANQVFTWLSGLPLRSRCGPLGLEHEPWAFDTARLLADGAVDLLLWVSSFQALPPPATGLPLVVLGPATLAAACHRRGALFIPVATPGIGTAGHVFRTDGTVLMPLQAVREDGLPTVADVAQRWLAALKAPAT